MVKIIANNHKMTLAIIFEPSDAVCTELISMGVINTRMVTTRLQFLCNESQSSH